MIVNKYANGGGSGSGSTDLSGYWNSAETQVHIDSAVTPVSEHLFDVEQVTASALTELHDGLLEVSARTVDMSGYYTSAQTEEAIAEALSGFTPAGNSNILAAISSLTEYEAISGSVKSGDLIQVWGVDINDDGEPEYGLFANVASPGMINWERKDSADSLLWADKDYPWLTDNDVYPVDFGSGSFLISLAEGGYNGIGFDGEGKPVITHIVPEEDEQTGEITGMTREDTPIDSPKVLKGVFDYPAEAELGDMVSKLETMPTFWWYDGDNITLKMHIDPLVLDTEAAYNVISFETQADGVLYGRILYDDHNQVMTLKFFDEEDNEVYLLGNLNKARYLDIAIGDGYYVSIGFLDDDFTSEGGRMLQVGRTDGTFGNWQGNTGQIPELEVEDIEVEDKRTGEMIPGIPAAIGPWFYSGDGWMSVGDYATGPIWKTIDSINSNIDTLNSDIDTLDEVVSAALVDLNEKKVESEDIKHIVKLTQAEYDQLATKDPETFYIIVNSI